jgi:hypothetical protein
VTLSGPALLVVAGVALLLVSILLAWLINALSRTFNGNGLRYFAGILAVLSAVYFLNRYYHHL